MYTYVNKNEQEGEKIEIDILFSRCRKLEWILFGVIYDMCTFAYK